MIEIQILLVFMIIAALIAVEIRGLLSSVVSLGAVGLALSVCFLILKAPDLAIVQLVVEIMVLIILIRVTAKKDDMLNFSTRRDLFYYITAILIVIIFWVFMGNMLKELPLFGLPKMELSNMYIKKGLSETGTSNIVASVALGYRILDTLGQIIVLFAATVGLMAIMRKNGKK